MGKGNLRRWIETVLDRDEKVESVVIGVYGDGYTEDPTPTPLEKKGVPIPWDEAKKYLDYDFDDDWGAPNCHAVYVWTNKNVYFVCSYDGRTWISWVPRNPKPCSPTIMGGW